MSSATAGANIVSQILNKVVKGEENSCFLLPPGTKYCVSNYFFSLSSMCNKTFITLS